MAISFEATTPRFWTLWRITILGLLIRLLLAPWTALAGDVATWFQVAERSMQGIGLYTLTGYSYPPLYGYWAEAVGSVVHLLGGSPASLAHVIDPAISPALYKAFGQVVTTPLGTLLFKLPMIGADLATGWCLWRVTTGLGGTTGQARRVFAWWFLNPLVIVTSSLHGQIDSLAAFSVALVVLGVVENRWALVGAAISLGVAAKLIPGFMLLLVIGLLWGMKGQHRLQRFGWTAAGGTAAAAVLLGPVMGSGLFVNVFTRASVSIGMGGLGLTGLAHFNGSSTFLTWFDTQSLPISKALSLSQFGIAIWLSVRCAKRPTQVTFIQSSLVLLSSFLLLSPVTNPQYIVWVLPLAVLGISGILGSWRQYQLGLILLATAPLYLFGLFGWRALCAPLVVATGWPSVGSVLSEQAALAAQHAPIWLLSQWTVRWDFLATVLVSTGLVLLTVIGVRDTPVTTEASTAVCWSRRRWAALTTVTALVSVEVLGLVGPSLITHPNLDVAVSQGAKTTSIRVSGPADSNVQVTAFAVDPRRSITTIAIFSDGQYPYANSSQGTVLGLGQLLTDQLYYIDRSVRIKYISAAQWVDLLKMPSSIFHTLVVNATGLMPAPVFSAQQRKLLTYWLNRGGRMVFYGDVPGYYSSVTGSSFATDNAGQFILARNVTVMGPEALIGRPVFLPTDWASPTLRATSPWGKALGTTYVEDNFAMKISELHKLGGAVIGHVGNGKTSEGFIPIGHGGILSFGGPADDNSMQAAGYDISQLISSDWFARSGNFVTSSLRNARMTLTVATPPSGDDVRLFAFDSNYPLWIDSRMVAR